jgi:hypothetical protein
MRARIIMARTSKAHGPLHRSVELGIAAFTALLGAIVVVGSIQAGIGWASDGPRSGFFPFYIGLFILVGSAVNFAATLGEDRKRLFAEWGQLRQVLLVVVPTAIYVVAIPYAGIYVSSIVLIAAFMKWLGRYKWPITLAVAFGVMIAIYFMFERWFLVPLPKGPIEDWLGL